MNKLKNYIVPGLFLALLAAMPARAAAVDLELIELGITDAQAGIIAAVAVVVPLALTLFAIKWGGRWVKGLVKVLSS